MRLSPEFKGQGVAFGLGIGYTVCIILATASGHQIGTLGSSHASSIQVKCRFRDNIEMKGKGKAEMGC